MNPVLRVEHLSKSFPGVRALKDVRLAVQAGTVHALMGENGAGKSTLLRILAGLTQPDEPPRGGPAPLIEIDGHCAKLRSPHDALQLGIAMIHQELLPFAEMSVAENIFMGREPVCGPAGWVDRARMHRDAAGLLDKLGARVSPAAKMKRLSVAEMQTVEIAKALVHEARVIIMDEPTSAISAHEVDALLALIRELKAQGVAIIYVSHKMDEILRIADVVTVLRDGEYVGSLDARDATPERLIEMMVGRAIDLSARRTPAPHGDVMLEVRELSGRGRFENVSFAVRAGEVLGIAGLMGAGRTEVLAAIAGLVPAGSGEIRVRGQPVRIRSPRGALARGIALVSEDRKRLGLVLGMSVKENITLADLASCCRGPFIDTRQEAATVDAQIAALGIKTPHRDQRVRLLSGGNQQKVVLAKALLGDPDILLLDEPTRGIDVAAKAEVYALIGRLAREGKAVVVVSSELPEILALSDRVLVMRQGRITAELSGPAANQERIMEHAMLEAPR